MGRNSKIEWTNDTWNPITGCSVVSPGCTNCYAMKLAGTRMKHHPSRCGLTVDTKAGPVWNGEIRLNEDWLNQPLRWRKPRMIFVCAHGDLFHEHVPDEWIDRVFAVMALSPQHTFQVLTKRSARMRQYLTRDGAETAIKRLCREKLAAVCAGESGARDRLGRRLAEIGIPDYRWPLPNVWLGVSVEDQQRADERIPDLLATPAALRFVSAEPLLGPVNFLVTDSARHEISALRGLACDPTDPDGADEYYRTNKIDWVIVGGESGRGARPMHPDWARSLLDQCELDQVPFFFKQWGEWAPGECVTRVQTRTEDVADWWGDRWKYGRVSRQASEEMHRDDEPDVWRAGKKYTLPMLDGREWREMPER